MRRLALLAMLASCTFPDVTFGDASTPLPEAGSDVVVTDDAGADAEVEAGDPCDEDNDHYKSLACDGGDCNDHDPRVHPGQDFVYDEPDSAPYGDWNCDGTVEPKYLAASCGATTCNSTGYASASGSGCGISNPFVSCTGSGLLCTPVDAGMVTQGCK